MKKKILILDDKETIAKVLSIYLMSDYDVQWLSDVLQGVEWLQAGNTPDLIISDIRMPGMRGDDFLEWIKQNELFRHIPVIMLSSEDSTSERIRLLEIGAVDYIVKQDVFSVRDELNLLIQFCNGSTSDNGVVDTAFHVDIAFFSRHVVGDENDIYVTAFLSQIGDGCDVLVTYIPFEEYNEMFVGDMRCTNLSSILVNSGHTNQLSRDVFQSFLCLRIVA